MAASVSYRINGKYDGKAVTQAQKGMNDLASTGKKLAGALGVAFSMTKVVQGLQKATQTFRENNKEQTRFYQALSKNSKTAQSDIKGLVKEFDNMAGIFAGSELVKGGTFLAQMGLSEDQMREATKLAQNMAASGIMPLEQAFQALGKSYAGNVTQLKKLYPELKNITAEELAQGKAVDVLNDRFDGMADAYAKSVEGRLSVLRNKIDGIADSLGTVGGFLITEGSDGMGEFIDRVRNLADNVMPQIAAWCATIAHTFANIDLSKIFSLMPIKNYFSFLADTFVKTLDWIKARAKRAVTNAEIEANEYEYNRAKESLQRYDSMSPKQFEKLSALEKESVDNLRTLVKDYEKLIAEQKQQSKMLDMPFSQLIEELASGYSDLIKNNLGVLSGEDAAAYFQKMLEKYGIFKTDNVAMAGEGSGSGGTFTADDGTGKTGGGIWGLSLEDQAQALKDGIIGSLGDVGTVIQSALDGSTLNIWLALLSSAISVISSKTTILTEFLGSISAFLGEVFTPEVIDMLNSFLGPVMDTIISLGKAVGSLLSIAADILTPILMGLSKAVSLVAKVIETIGAICYNIYAAVYNGAHLFGKKKSYKSISDIWSDSGNTNYSGYSAAVSSTSSTASYNAARDIYVTINYNNSYVNGDAREIALNLRAEIAAAERLGL